MMQIFEQMHLQDPMKVSFIFVAFMVCFCTGVKLVQRLRHLNLSDTNQTSSSSSSNERSSFQLLRPSHLVFLAPIILHLVFKFITKVFDLDISISNFSLIGILVGILKELKGSNTKDSNKVKVIFTQLGNKGMVPRSSSLLISSMDVTILEIRKMIARAMSVHPEERVQIESLKGHFLTDLNKPLDSVFLHALQPKDFWGLRTIKVFYKTKECKESDKHKLAEEERFDTSTVIDENKKNKSSVFRSMIPQLPAVKYSDQLSFTAKLPSSNSSFCISLVNRYAAAAPTSSIVQASKVPPIKFLSWNSVEREGSQTSSHAAPSQPTPSTGMFIKGTKRGGGSFFKRNSVQVNEGVKFGQPIRHGDEVVLECCGKYLSVTGNSWLAWMNFEPRTSGAFIVEVVQQGQHDLVKINEQIRGQIKSISTNFTKLAHQSFGDHFGDQNNQNLTIEGMSALSSPNDRYGPYYSKRESGGGDVVPPIGTIVRQGDLLRLRSVKYPDKEVGVTGVKIQGDFCHLALRHVEERGKVGLGLGSGLGLELDRAYCLPALFSASQYSQFLISNLNHRLMSVGGYSQENDST